MLTWDKLLNREAHTHTHHKVRQCESTDQKIKAGLRGPLPPFDPPTSGAPLKNPNSSLLLVYIFCLPQLPLYPAAGCCVHTIQLCRLREQRVKLQWSALDLRPLPFTHDTSVLCRALPPTGSAGFSLSIHSNSSFSVFFSARCICCNLIYLCCNASPRVQHVM